MRDNPSIQNIVFYSTDHPINTLTQDAIEYTSNDWYNALLADTVSFNRAVTSRYAMDGSSTQATNTWSTNERDSKTLVGYINITLDINTLRLDWLKETLFLRLTTLILGIMIIWLILRKLNWPSKDITELADVCSLIINDPELKQLPVIQQHFNFQELMCIKQGLLLLFERLQVAEHKYASLAEFEQQLYQKDISLNVQRHNFQSMITHELKTSLNAISGGLQLLDNQYLTYDQQDTLAIIHKGTQQLELTLEQIIQLNKIEKGQVTFSLSEFKPLQMIADLLLEFDPIAQQKGVELISRIHHIDYALEGDVDKIQQVLSTLIDNALKFTEQGQVIIESQLTHFNNSIRWQLKVSDTGIGIDAGYIGDIFTPFFQVDSSKTRRHKGAGFGLPVAKQMLQIIGASIEVSSKLGKGSQFTVVIPLRNEYKGWQQTLLNGLNIVYYYAEENNFLVKELQRLGASVIYQQQEQLMINQLMAKKIDMVMFAADILPERVAQLAHLIREYETVHRALLIYWYPAQQKHTLHRVEHGLKVAGINYCQAMTQKLVKLLKHWTGRA